MLGRDAPAIFSPCRQYRYVLRRRVGWGPSTCLFIMLNPSTADEEQEDPTVRRCMDYAHRWGYGVLVVCNIFALRATDPTRLYQAPDPVGPENDAYILEEASRADCVVAAWGNHGALNERSHAVRVLLADVLVQCLGINRSGAPKHPLYIARDQPLMVLQGGMTSND